jgi:hypothetical protein
MGPPAGSRGRAWEEGLERPISTCYDLVTPTGTRGASSSGEDGQLLSRRFGHIFWE